MTQEWIEATLPPSPEGSRDEKGVGAFGLFP